MVTTESDLPQDAVDAIHGNRKIETIRLLREYCDINLKEAKERFEYYIKENRHVMTARAVGPEPEHGTQNKIITGITRLKGFLLLRLLEFSLFFMVFAPFEIHQTVAAREWKPVQAVITTSRIREISNHYSPDLALRETESGQKYLRTRTELDRIDVNAVYS